MITPVAQLHNVHKSFGPVAALDGLSLSINPGELLALLGSNGAGKTTAVRLLLGLLKPDSGTARIFGQDPRDRTARARIGAMLQVASMPETLKVRELIDFFRSYYPSPLSMSGIVQAAGLDGIEERLFGRLSGGQKQRVLFALALCGNPKLLFLDEPTLGLDVEARRGLWRVIRQFVDRGGSVLLTTHYLDEAGKVSDRVVVLDRGRAIADASPADLAQGAGLEDAFLSIIHNQQEEVLR